ncbi:MAG: hypothetical protein ACLR67_13450, partial [Eggerthella lenta]
IRTQGGQARQNRQLSLAETIGATSSEASGPPFLPMHVRRIQAIILFKTRIKAYRVNNFANNAT